LEAGAIPARSNPICKARVFKSAEASGFEVVFVKIEGLVYFIA
jgi:hypothetical protein